MDSNFYTTLTPHQSVRVKKVLNDDKLYTLLFNSWYPADEELEKANDYPAINEKLDALLYDFIDVQKHNTLIEALTKMQFNTELYNNGIEAALNECLGTHSHLYDKWRLKESKTSMGKMKIILINRMFDAEYGFKKNFKPLVVDAKPKPLRKVKYNKTNHIIKEALLFPLYLLP